MVRHYDQQGYLRHHGRATGQHRRFDDEDVQQLLLLRALLSAGVPPSTAGRVTAGTASGEELQQADQLLSRAAEQTRTARRRLVASAQQVPAEQQLSLAFDLFLARTQIETLLSLELQPAGISSGDYAVLSLVSMERLTPTSLARLVGGAPSTLARRLGALVDKGWLTRSADPLNPRSWVVDLTPEGEDRLDLALPLARRLFRRLDEAIENQGLDRQVLRSELQLFSAVVHSMLPPAKGALPV